MFELIIDFLEVLIPDALEEFFSGLIDKHIRHRGVRSVLKTVLFVAIGLMTIAVVILFFSLLILLLGIVMRG
jgi:hypothetical protein